METRGDVMLCKFKVKGYKGFNDEIELDLTNHNDYKFNGDMIKENIINKAIVYGKNASGKSNLGLAIFDIIFHLTDKNRSMEGIIKPNYLNLDGNHKYAEFSYEFKFGNEKIIYKYRKENLDKLIYEEIEYNGEKIVQYDFLNPENKIIKVEDAEYLNWEYNDKNLSAVKYICNNSRFNNNNPLAKMMDFVNGMLWFKSVDFNAFIGLQKNADRLDNIIIENNKTDDFQAFLKKYGIEYEIVELDTLGGKILGVKKQNILAAFESIISSGTRTLWLYYCWEIYFSKVKFLFIDEFDATYHFELSAEIVKRINKQSSFQSILTTHNTYLLSNKLSRPDCSFVVDGQKIKSLPHYTEKELREAHNIEKLYREGEFLD